MRRPLSPIVEIIIGAISTIALNVGVALSCIVIGTLSASVYAPLFSIVFVAAAIGLAQLAYILPICIYLMRKRKWNWIKGIIIGACITALLNGGCWLLIAPTMIR